MVKFSVAVFVLTWMTEVLPSSALSMATPPHGRRAFVTQTASAAIVAAAAAATVPLPALAAPEIVTTSSGIKYAILKQSKDKASPPLEKDIVAIEYTGYLANGQIFDATHSEGKKNALMFEVGGNAVIDGLNEMVKEMGVGQKVQAIIPPELAFGDKGICLDSGECLVKPKSTLVYDISLKRAAIPPP